MRENPVIADWVHFKGGITEGLLGGWLAQRQAALRGKLAAGARCDFTLVSRACRNFLEQLACHRKTFPGNLERLSVSEAGDTESNRNVTHRRLLPRRGARIKSIVRFNNQQMVFKCHNTHKRVDCDTRALARARAPKLPANQHRTIRIET